MGMSDLKAIFIWLRPWRAGNAIRATNLSALAGRGKVKAICGFKVITPAPAKALEKKFARRRLES
jgi:hypothetical protein